MNVIPSIKLLPNLNNITHKKKSNELLKLQIENHVLQQTLMKSKLLQLEKSENCANCKIMQEKISCFKSSVIDSNNEMLKVNLKLNSTKFQLTCVEKQLAVLIKNKKYSYSKSDYLKVQVKKFEFMSAHNEDLLNQLNHLTMVQECDTCTETLKSVKEIFVKIKDMDNLETEKHLICSELINKLQAMSHRNSWLSVCLRLANKNKYTKDSPCFNPRKPFKSVLSDKLIRKYRHIGIKKSSNLCHYNPDTLAAHLLTQYKTAPERLRMICVLEKRLCRMTCSEARLILDSFQLTNSDRLGALECVKRSLIDHQSTEGMEYILAAFPFTNDKLRAMSILATVSTYVAEKLAAGGHQLYGAVGGLYSQSFPLRPNFYGPVESQLDQLPGQGAPNIAPSARPGKVESLYTNHPSYRYENGVSWNKSMGEAMY